MSKLILQGSSSRLLAQKIARRQKLNCKSHRIVHFVNSEMKITLPKSINEFDSCCIVQSTSTPANDHFMELCLLIDTLKREGIDDISAIIPYFGYARQDKQHLPKECVSIETICKILQTLGLKEILTCDIHKEEAFNKFSLPVKNISVMPALAPQIYKDLGLDKTTEQNFTIASPDEGGIIRAELFAKNFYKNQNNQKLVSIKKKRHLTKAHYCEAVELKGDAQNRKVILIDDISTSGSTILNAVTLLEANGVNEVYVVIVHADFAKGVPEKFQNSKIQKVYTTNTIEKTVENLDFYDKVKVFDISKVFESLT
jgi:ribose-phosphate pyrophosphokinase